MAWLQGGDLIERATDLLDEYREIRAELSTEAVVNAIERGAARTVGQILDLEAWDRTKLRDALLPERLAVLPDAFPDERWSATAEMWNWGLQPVGDVCLIVMDLLRRGLAITREPHGRHAGGVGDQPGPEGPRTPVPRPRCVSIVRGGEG